MPDDGLEFLVGGLNAGLAAVHLDVAIAIANAESGFNKGATSSEAWLRRVTHPNSPMLLTDRAVWIVHYASVVIRTSSIPLQDGTTQPGRVLTNAFVFIDASSGDFILNTYTP